MNTNEKVKILLELEPVIDYNVRRIFNYYKSDYEDLMQEARMLIYNSLDKYSAEKGSLSTFCQILIKNNLVNITIKNYRNWNNISYNDEYIDSHSDDEVNQLKLIYKKLELLLIEYSDKFSKNELTFGKLLLSGLSFKEIESIMNINTNHRVQLAFQFKKKVKSLIKEVE